MRLGGLGANIGGDDWVEKKKKLDKMQVIIVLFSNSQARWRVSMLIKLNQDLKFLSQNKNK